MSFSQRRGCQEQSVCASGAWAWEPEGRDGSRGPGRLLFWPEGVRGKLGEKMSRTPAGSTRICMRAYIHLKFGDIFTCMFHSSPHYILYCSGCITMIFYLFQALRDDEKGNRL